MGDSAVPIKMDTTPKFGEQGDAAFTLRSRENGGGINDMVAHPVGRSEQAREHTCGNIADAAERNWRGYEHQPIVMTTANTNANGSNVNWDGACYTRDGANSNAVAFTQNQRDEVRLEGVDGSLVGSLHTGSGKNDHYVMSHEQTSYVCMQDGQAKGAVEDDLSTTLNASHEQPIVCAADDNGKAAIEEDMSGALKVGGGAP